MSRDTLTVDPSTSPSSAPLPTFAEAGDPFEPDETQAATGEEPPPSDDENQSAASDHLPPD